MIGDVARLLVLISCFCRLSSDSQTQISHLQDWTTIPKFDIVFAGKPNADTPNETNQQLPLLDYNVNLENGTKYSCSIPDIDSLEKQSQDDLESEVMDHMTPEQIRSKVENNFEVSIRGKCVRKSEGFWVFEVCPFKEARQIHTDGNRELLAFSLGKFYRSSWDEEGNLVQEFQHGTDSRSCKAVFSCGSKRNSAEPISFMEAREPAPLKYLLRLETPSLCTHEQKSTTPYSMLYAMNSKCIFLNKGWWSYEFCHLAHVRQFHSERIKAEPVAGESVVRFQTVTTASFILGRFLENASDPESVNNQTKLVMPNDSSSQPYFSQRFSGGSECDLTGKKRETVIRFLCNKNIESAKFASIKELKTCSYVAEIEVPTLCTHPKFSTKDPVVYNIRCTSQIEEKTSEEALNTGPEVSHSTTTESTDNSLQSSEQRSPSSLHDDVQVPEIESARLQEAQTSMQNSAANADGKSKGIAQEGRDNVEDSRRSNEKSHPDKPKERARSEKQPEIAMPQKQPEIAISDSQEETAQPDQPQASPDKKEIVAASSDSLPSESPIYSWSLSIENRQKHRLSIQQATITNSNRMSKIIEYAGMFLL